MSHWDWMEDARAGIALLRRINSGDESAFREIEPLLKRIDDRDARHQAKQREKLARREKRAKIGRKNSGQFEIAPSHEGGVGFPASGIVLLRKDKVRLVWRSGGKYWSGIGTTSYAPADLDILEPSGWGVKSTSITDNHGRSLHGKRDLDNRLTVNLILKYRAAINKVFGENAAELVAAGGLKHTVVLGDTKSKRRES